MKAALQKSIRILTSLFGNDKAETRTSHSPAVPTTPFQGELVLPTGLSDGQIVALLGNLSPQVRSVALFVLETGLSTSEIFGLQWTDIVAAHDGRSIKVGHRIVPLSDTAWMVLRTQYEERKERFLVFDRSLASSIVRVLREAGLKAGIDGICMKVLRNTFAARLYRHGVSLSRVRGLFGFTTATMRVVRSTPAQLREAIDTFDRNRVF